MSYGLVIDGVGAGLLGPELRVSYALDKHTAAPLPSVQEIKMRLRK